MLSYLTRDFGSISPLDDTLETIRRVTKSKKPETKIKHAARLGARVTGIPSIQVERAMRGQIMGGPRAKKEQRVYSP